MTGLDHEIELLYQEQKNRDKNSPLGKWCTEIEKVFYKVFPYSKIQAIFSTSLVPDITIKIWLSGNDAECSNGIIYNDPLREFVFSVSGYQHEFDLIGTMVDKFTIRSLTANPSITLNSQVDDKPYEIRIIPFEYKFNESGYTAPEVLNWFTNTFLDIRAKLTSQYDEIANCERMDIKKKLSM